MNPDEAVCHNPAVVPGGGRFLRIHLYLTDHLWDGVLGNRLLTSAGLPLTEWRDYHLPMPGTMDLWYFCPIWRLEQ